MFGGCATTLGALRTRTADVRSCRLADPDHARSLIVMVPNGFFLPAECFVFVDPQPTSVPGRSIRNCTQAIRTYPGVRAAPLSPSIIISRIPLDWLLHAMLGKRRHSIVVG